MKSLKDVAEENRLNALKYYVESWKRQDPDTVEVTDGIFSYKTKRGIVKRFQAIRMIEILLILMDRQYYKKMKK